MHNFFQGAGLLADYLADALQRNGVSDFSKVKVLDVACGTGTVGAALQRKGFHQVVGLDFSREMLDMAGKNHPGEFCQPWAINLRQKVDLTSSHFDTTRCLQIPDRSTFWPGDS